jgi:hypothetical protein
MRRIGIAVWLSLVIALAGLGLPAGVQAQGGDDGLVAEWHFDEGSRRVLHDSSGNDGVIHGATWADGMDYALFGDAVSESGEARDIVHRAFTILVDAGGCGMRWIVGAGMVVERVVG